MILALLTLLSAFAGDSALWAGVPLDRLDEAGLGAPTLTEGEDSWRAPVEGGGFAHLWILPDAAAAQQAFAAKAQMAATRTPPALPTTRDEAAGDGTGYLLVRDGNVVLLVRDPALQAAQVADRILEELVVTPPVVMPSPGSVVVEGRDACGRLTR